jgi:aryl-alcohol dehydrogenase-like predicted oxidoreductase
LVIIDAWMQDEHMTEGFELPGLAGLGTAPLGSGPGWELDWGRSDEAGAQSVVRAAASAGVGWIDTAPFYGWGRAERIVGSALAGPAGRPVTATRPAAGEPVLLTKCGTVPGPDGRSREDHRAATIRADLQASLARLGRSAVDVLQVHDPDPATPVEEVWRTVCELVAQGKARAGGLSNHPVQLMDRASAIGQVAVVQHQYSLLHRAPESDGVLRWCADRGIPFLAWSPLASGFLADRFELETLEPVDFRRRLPWADPARLELGRLRRDLARLANEAGLSMTALAVGWVLAKGARAIVGARTPAEAAAIPGYRPLSADLARAAEAAADRARR